jgi:protein-disulfide isomerase
MSSGITVSPLRTLLLAAAALGTLTSTPILGDPTAAGDPSVRDKVVIATVGSQQVTAGDIVTRNRDGFDELRSQRDQLISQAQHEYGSAYHELVQKDLQDYLDRRALELEAAERGTTTEALLGEVKAPPVSDDEAHALYEAHKNDIHQPYEKVEGEIRQYLAKQRNDTALRSFYDELRRKHAIAATLQPYRVPVAATGPVRGKASAPITIIEFADFQCPYCREAEASLHAVLSRHPNEVRLVFRNRPLPELHPDAVMAARAAVCAGRQDKFWEMHDAMFGDQSALGEAALKDTAARLGLDRQRFDSCLDDARGTLQALSVDNQAANELGINSTPYFFIDGLPVRGTLPPEQLEKLIEDELARVPPSRG